MSSNNKLTIKKSAIVKDHICKLLLQLWGQTIFRLIKQGHRVDIDIILKIIEGFLSVASSVTKC